MRTIWHYAISYPGTMGPGISICTATSPIRSSRFTVNRLFDDAFRSFDISPFSSQAMGWPSVELNETETEVKVVAELPGLEKDVNVELRDGLLTISGEKKSETEDKERRFSERYYGRFE